MEYTQLSPVVSGFYMGKKHHLLYYVGPAHPSGESLGGIFGQTMGVGDGRTSNG